MKYITILLLLTFSMKSFSQLIAPMQPTVVVKNPAWKAEDEAKFKLEMADRLREYGKLAEQVESTREHLKLVKDATKKLMEINRKIANYRYLEMALSNLNDALQKVKSTMRTLNESNCFSPAEYRMINESVLNLVNHTSFTIQAITVVVTDNFASMTDGERLSNLQESVKQLRDDLGVINNFLWELETLNNQRMQVKTLKYFNNTLKTK